MILWFCNEKADTAEEWCYFMPVVSTLSMLCVINFFMILICRVEKFPDRSIKHNWDAFENDSLCSQIAGTEVVQGLLGACSY